MRGKFEERLLTDDESVVEQFHPHWRTLLAPAAGSISLLAAAVAVAVVLADPVGLAVSAVAGMVAVGYGALALLNRAVTLYVLTTERLIWRWGIIRKQGVEIPLEQLNTVRFSQRFHERLLHYGDLIIESAGSKGISRFTDIPDPQGFQSTVYAVRDRRKRVIYGSMVVDDDGHPIADDQPVGTSAGTGGIAAAATPPAATVMAGRTDTGAGRWELLAHLAQLAHDGYFTAAEFAAAKQQLLDGDHGGPPPPPDRPVL